MTERCGWAGPEQIYIDYHDTEWGVPEYDSRTLWEKLILDGFQAGLSWITILKKRDNFRAAFAGFDPDIIATWGDAEVTRLLGDAGIIRHRGKIEATINNAQRALELIDAEGSLVQFLDGPVDHGGSIGAAQRKGVAIAGAIGQRPEMGLGRYPHSGQLRGESLHQGGARSRGANDEE